MNKIFVIGRLGDDPVTRFTKKGKKATSLRVASNSYEQGQEITIWYNVTIWDEHPLIPHLKKGSAVVIVGELREPHIWEDRNGQQRISLEIWANDVSFSPVSRSASDSSSQSSSQESHSYAAPQQPEYGHATASSVAGNATEDDLPF